MNKHALPERWAIKLQRHIKDELKSERDTLSVNAFRQDLKIEFPDGSKAYFRYAFYLADEKLNEVAVFTEHCGYHVFPLYDATLELIDR